MKDDGSLTNKQIEVLKEHIAYLRTEVDKNTELLRSAIRYLLLGIAGLVALREKFDLHSLQELLPLAPALVMALVALFLTPTSFIVRTGRWMAQEERRLNEMVGATLLTYEEALFDERRARFFGHRQRYIVSIIAVSVFYWLAELFFVLNATSELTLPVKVFFFTVAALPWLICLNYMKGLLRVFIEPLARPGSLPTSREAM